MLDRILAAVDNSTEGARALRLAIELAHEIGADLKVIIVLKPLPACFSFAVSAISPRFGSTHSCRNAPRFIARQNSRWPKPAYIWMPSWSRVEKCRPS